MKKTFEEKYTNESDKEEGKKVISDDAYAIGEMLDVLIKSIRITNG